MKAKEKAKELVEKFEYNGVMIDDIRMSEEDAKQCALICVDEMIRAIKQIQFNYDIFLEDTEISYWWKVKQKINKL